jgi:hypothetical protein
MANTYRNQHTGRYAHSQPCDGCGKPCGLDPMTDAEVCGSTDGPGFFLCARISCETRRDALDLQGRRALYSATRLRTTAR